MEFKSTFIKGKMNRDIDERLLPKGEYPYALNIRVANSDASDMGAIENSRGNKVITDLDLDLTAKAIGVLADSSNRLLYGFITSSTKDLIIEYNETTGTTEVLLESTNPNGVLNFSENNLITGVNKVLNGHPEKDLLLWTDDRNPPRVINIERAKTIAVDGFTEDDITLIKKPPRYAPTTNLTYVAEGLENNLESDFLAFSYRYKYKDGFYSALSSFSNYAFSPREFNIDYETMENTGMKNAYNAVDITFNTGGSNITDVEVVYKESGSNSLYIIESFNKEDEGWLDNEERSLTFSNSKRYQQLPTDELLRTYDNVPRLAKAQDLIGNRLVFGNYLEGYNMVDSEGNRVDNDYTVGVESRELIGEEVQAIVGIDEVSYNLSGVSLTEGKRLLFNIDLKGHYEGVDNDGIFDGQFDFVLNRDYTNASDLANDPDFILFVETIMTARFMDDYDVTPPDDSTLISNTNFVIENVTSTTFEIKSPELTFQIDETPLDPNDSEFTDKIMYWHYKDASNLVLQEFDTTASAKSNRSYEVGIVYLDPEGRKSTVETCRDNTVSVGHELSNSKNNLRVTLNHPAPYWADRYKFVVKQNKGDYETIYTNIFYEEGLYRWVKLEGANINKVKEGDTLIVKSDLGGVRGDLVTTRVLALENKQRDFIEANTTPAGVDIVEESGLYMKIKPSGFDMSFNGATVQRFEGGNHLRYAVKTYTEPAFPTPTAEEPFVLEAGSTVKIRIHFRGRGSITYNAEYEETFKVNDDYTTVQSWFDSAVGDLGEFGIDYTWDGLDFLHNGIDYGYFGGDEFNRGSGWGFEDGKFWVLPHRDGTTTRNITTHVSFEIRFSDGVVIFETDPQEVTDNIFYETEETFDIIGGEHQGNVQNQVGATPAICDLSFFNCFVSSNGSESYKFKDVFNESALNIDLRPSSTSIERYAEIRRFAELTYSEPYVENTSLNGLNEFNLSRANYKEDLEKKYGSIQKIYARDTDLVVLQEDKVSKVLYGKSLLLGADGEPNVTSIDQVLGQQVPYAGEYGISRNPESFAFDSMNLYFTDAKRGCALRLGANGIVEISNTGLRTWFKDRFRDLENNQNVVGTYDPYYDQYILSFTGTSSPNEITYDDTLTFDEQVKGWSSFHSFTPDLMAGMNNSLYSFKDGQLYRHHDKEAGANNYYGAQNPSKVSIIINDAPSEIKALKTINQEASTPWEVDSLKAFKTNIDNFIESSIKISEFVEKEGHWFAYVRRNEDDSHIDSKSAYGIGRVNTVATNTFTLNGGSESLTSGDRILRGADLALIGTVTNVSGDTVTMDDGFVNTPVSGDYIIGKKNARIEGGNLRGYTFRADLSLSTNKKEELYAVNAEVMKSNP